MPDEANLVDKTKGGYLVAKRKGDATAGSAVRLIRMYRIAPLRPLAAIADVLGSEARDLSNPSEHYVALDGEEAAQRCAAYDAVEITGFTSERDAMSFVHSPTARDQRLQLGGMVRGCDMFVARLIRVF